MTRWRTAFEEALGVRITGVRPVGGGCMAHASRVETSAGVLFCKRGSGQVGDALAAERRGLEELRLAAPSSLRIPRVESFVTDPETLLVLEWIEAGPKTGLFWQALGEGLSELHKSAVPRFGYQEDNFIGSTPQANRWMDAWPLFFRDRRLAPQVALAKQRGLWSAGWDAPLRQVMDEVEDLLPDLEGGHLVHGDLWAGNVMADAEGRPVLIDPAVYYGDPWADIGMTRLFGGFDARFYRAYTGEPPPEGRLRLYNLYHLLNHLNLFGRGYAGQVEASLRSML